MPENEFEKKVSSELQQLKFKPSETVWMKVEERIRGKKKRRVFIIFFLFGGIALLGYWQWNNIFGGKKEEIVKTETIGQEKNNTTSNNDQNKIEENKQDDRTTGTRSDVENNNIDEKQKPTIDNRSANKVDNTISNNDVQHQTVIEKKIKISGPSGQKEKKSNVAKRKSTPGKKREVTISNDDLVDITNKEPASAKDVSKVKDTGIDNVNQDLDQKKDKQVQPNADVSKPDSTVKKDDIKKDSLIKKVDTVSKAIPVDSPMVSIPKNPINKNKKWKFGIEFTPGISSFKEDIFSFNMNKSADLNASPGTVSGAVPFAPVKTNSGFGFQIGGYVKKQFTRKSSLTLGMRWAYYSDKLHIGTRMYRTTSPSSSFSQALYSLGVNSAYRADGGTSSYKEDYHFIEFPVNYQVQINKSSIHPLSLYIGVKIGRLLSSNAVAYDTVGGGIYYQSTKYLNKTQFGFTGGLSWKINKHDKFQITAGPVLDLHLNSLVDNPFDKKKYLLFTGLRTSVFFNSKK